MIHTVFVAGLSHRSAPIDIREQLALEEDKLREVLRDVAGRGVCSELMILSTCNRVEVYGVAAVPGEARSLAFGQLASQRGLAWRDLEPLVYTVTGEEAALHAFRVAASLDSLVLGESQILSQVKAAYEVARAQGVTGPILNTLMTRSLGVAKKVRAETGIGEAAVSIPSAAIGLAKTIFGELSGRTVLILGAGEMTKVAVRHLKGEGVQAVVVAHRHFDRAVEMAAELEGRAVRFDQIRQELLQADIVLSSTAAPHYIVHRADVEELIRLRRNRPLFLIDIAVPRDIDPAVNEIDNVYLYDIDDLEGVVAAHRLAREREAEQAELLIDREVASFLRWLKSLEVVPTLVMLRRHLEEIREAELARALSRLPELTPAQQDVVRTLAHGIINKVLHHPTTELKRQSVNRDGLLYVSALRRLFGLQDDD